MPNSASANQTELVPFMLASKRLIPVPAYRFQYNKRRQVNVTKEGGRIQSTVLLPSTLAHLKSQQAQGGED